MVLSAALVLLLPAAAQEPRFPPDMASVKAALAAAPAMPAVKPFIPPPAAIWYEPPVPGLDSPESREYEGQARRLAAQGGDFSAIFAGLCRRLLDSPRTARRPRHELGSAFRGLIRWTRNGGKSVWQGRDDWPRHFIYGGYLATVYGYPAAEAAALVKEERDARAPGNAFDLDDYAATLLGARWAQLSGLGEKALRRWTAPWAAGQRTLNALPPLRFGRLAHGRSASPARLREVQAFVRAALPR